MKISETGYAKINLGLDVLGLRPDKYHEVAMVMQAVSLCDKIEITPAPALLVTTNCPQLPGGPENLAYQAAVLMGRFADREPQVHIHIRKHIFMAAGLAGGSADAAAVVRGLDRYWQLGHPLDRLERLGAQLGSDVPFCIAGGTALATGRGELLEALPDLPSLELVLAKPKVAVATPWVYREYDKEKNIQHPDIELLTAKVRQGDVPGMLACCGNVLSVVTERKYPLITRIKDTMLEAGASFAMMSGSGPTVFGVVPGAKAGKAVIDALAPLDVELAQATTIGRRILA